MTGTLVVCGMMAVFAADAGAVAGLVVGSSIIGGLIFSVFVGIPLRLLVPFPGLGQGHDGA